MDKDKDGYISAEELLAILADSGSISEKEKKKAVDLLDTLDMDGDGKVNKSDWIKAFGVIFEELRKARVS